jgi:serine/threonine protein kinase
MNDVIFNIVNENNVIGKGSFGKVYYSPKSYPEYIVKKMEKYKTRRDNGYSFRFIQNSSNLISNNIKELWWYSLKLNISKHTYLNIPKLHEYHINDDCIYLLLDYKGESIYYKLKKLNNELCSHESVCFDTERYIELLKNIPLIIYSCSKIFQYLHYADLRHGDITTCNIMYNDNSEELNKISIIDWGSIVFTKLIINNYNQCASGFIAPELYEQDTYENLVKPTIKSDIFSLGLVILKILDPFNEHCLKINDYIKKYEINEVQHDVIPNIIQNIKDKISIYNINLENYLDERVFYLLTKMLELNICNRIDSDSLYMDSLFEKYRKQEPNFDKFYLKNILRNEFQSTSVYNFPIDNFKNFLVENTYKYLKKFKFKVVKNFMEFKYIDTRIILTPVLKLFYKYLNKLNTLSDTELNEKKLNNCVSNTLNFNHYIISFLCCLKWIDIIFNNDIPIFDLFDFYTYLYTLISSDIHNDKYKILNSTEFFIFFDITFYNIFDLLDGSVLIYPYILDFKHDFIVHRDVKKILLNLNHI